MKYGCNNIQVNLNRFIEAVSEKCCSRIKNRKEPITIDEEQFPVDNAYPNDFVGHIDITKIEKPEKRYFNGLFVYKKNRKKFTEIVKDCLNTELNVQKLFEAIHECIRLKSPQRTQIIALTIFAPFAFFAVRFLCYSNGSPGTNTKGN